MKRALGALCVSMLLAVSQRASAVSSRTPDTEPVLPAIDATRKAALRGLLLEGREAPYGNRGNVFAKVGDSITASDSFLQDCLLYTSDAADD